MGATCGKVSVMTTDEVNKKIFTKGTILYDFIHKKKKNEGEMDPDYTIKSSIDERIIKILQKKKLARDNNPITKNKNFDRIVLQFSMVEIAFRNLRVTYDHFAHKDGILRSDLKTVLNYLGAKVEEKDIHEIFSESDLRKNESLDFNEFVVSLAIGYLLELIPEMLETNDYIDNINNNRTNTKTNIISNDVSNNILNDNNHNVNHDKVELAKAFNIIVDAYLLFDEDASGIIKWDEMKKILDKTAEESKRKSEGGASSLLTEARWKELDWNSDGSITFQEFLLAFQNWVGLEEDEER